MESKLLRGTMPDNQLGVHPDIFRVDSKFEPDCQPDTEFKPTFHNKNEDTTYSTFHPDSYKDVQPIYVSTTNYVGGLYQSIAGEPYPIYDSTVDFRMDFFALNHHTYLYACDEGTYRIDIPYSNDAVYLWIGAKAYAGWTDENADAKARYDQPDHIAGSATFEFTIPAGTYVPLRFFYGQAQYGGGFYFNVTAPSGQVLVSNEATSSPYVVRNSCDGVIAPPYPPFGSEI
ncbi:putative conidiospore surface protein [Phaeoacremonium minimum UCRPA7]|uniref:Putative conidiospore surface protein n=1 Tax=Phaeoacremonium minimum (strain UCR-PA7) TaxID=1286976 RepID=R8BCW8_PHAM7|nr:putative conidiospore surface protein [Phaeoacremonium minimum UCRPA7]EON97154.1 putative conidiospore surface protein [Phaeoacremonium minimum UCRPA7]